MFVLRFMSMVVCSVTWVTWVTWVTFVRLHSSNCRCTRADSCDDMEVLLAALLCSLMMQKHLQPRTVAPSHSCMSTSALYTALNETREFSIQGR